MRIHINFLHRWEEFWFRKSDGFDLFLGRFFFYGLLFILYLSNFRNEALIPWANVSDTFWEPISFFKWLPLHTHSELVLHYVTTLLCCSMLLSCFGILTRISTKVCFFVGLFYFGYPNNFGKIHHLHHLSLILMGILAFSNCGDGFSIDSIIRNRLRTSSSKVIKESQNYYWSLQLIRTAMVLVYFSAGIQKMKNSGIAWVFSDNLSSMILAWGVPFGVWFVTYFKFLCPLLAAATLFGELFAPLALFSKKAAQIIIPDLFLFNVGSRILMGTAVAFTPWMICFVFWIPFCAIRTEFSRLRKMPVDITTYQNQT